MKSFQDLNNHSQTSLDAPDERGSKVIFDRVAPLQPLDTIEQITSTTVVVEPGIEIIEIINYATANVRYRVTIITGGSPALVGSTVSWASIPSGLTLTTVGNVSTISGITTLAHWASIRTFNWLLPANYASCPLWYLDVAVVYYDSELNQDVIVDWEIYDPDNYYISLMFSEASMIANFSKVKFAAAALTSISTTSIVAGYLQSTSASLSATASISAVGTTNPTNMVSVSTMSCQARYTVRPTLTLSSQSGFVGYNTTYIDLPRTVESYTTNTSTAISGGPLITDALQDGSGAYTMTVYPIPSTAVSSMSSFGRWSPVATQTLTEPFASTTWSAGAVSNDGEYMIAGADYASSYLNGYALLYQKINGQYVYYNNLSPLVLKFNAIQPTGVSGSSAGFAWRINAGTGALSNGAEYVALRTGTETGTFSSYVYIFKRSSATFTQQARTASLVEENDAGDLSFDNAGNILVDGVIGTFGAGTGRNAYVRVYRRATATWSLEQTIQPAEVLAGSNGAGAGFFGNAVSASGDGARIAIGAYYQGNITSFSPLTVSDVKWGAVYIYVYSAGTWTLEQRIVPADSTTNNQFGSQVKLNSDGSKLVAKSSTGIYVYARSGSTWTLESKAASYYGSTMASANNNLTYGYDEIINTGYETATYNVLTQFGTSWNLAAKTLTLTGTRSQINTDIDTIQLTPATGYSSSFDLRYTVITPRNRTDNRDQNVNNTP